MNLVAADVGRLTFQMRSAEDRKSTRLNSSHVSNSYAVFCSKKKNGGQERSPVHSTVLNLHVWALATPPLLFAVVRQHSDQSVRQRLVELIPNSLIRRRLASA